MKAFFSWIDASVPAPQPIQHLAIREYAAKVGGGITFYGAEEVKTLKSQSFVLGKLQKNLGIDGVVFYSVYQFGYGLSFNFNVMRQILRMNYEVHFAREGISISTEKALYDLFPFLLAVDYTKRRAATSQWKNFLSHVDLGPAKSGSADRSCRVCHGSDLEDIFDPGSLPVFHRLLATQDASEETFPFLLSLCKTCGLVQVCDPVDPERLYRYYNYNFTSWKPEPHRTDEIDTILGYVRPHQVFEIGCNEGLFLDELRQRTPLKGVGIEPNPVSGSMAKSRGFTVISEMISPAVCERVVAEHGSFDLVVSRQVIEHVHNLDNYFECIKMVLAPNGFVFLDTPDSEDAFRAGDATVLREEHCTYFTESVFLSLLNRHGFEVLSAKKHNFSGGTISVMSRRRRGPAPSISDPSDTVELAAGYGKRITEYAARLKAALVKARSKGFRIVLYGVGARGCAALNMLGLSGLIDFAIDDEKRRQGTFTPGARLAIRPPSVLKGDSAPILCLLAVNSESEAGVRRQLTELLASQQVHFASFCAPSDIWRDLSMIESL